MSLSVGLIAYTHGNLCVLNVLAFCCLIRHRWAILLYALCNVLKIKPVKNATEDGTDFFYLISHFVPRFTVN